jgi:proteasome lid subunit RPN8/RPN11
MLQPKINLHIFQHAKEVYPNECAGLITQKSRVQKYHRIDNISKTPEEHCEPDPAQYGDVVVWAEENGHEIIGFVHSHTGDGATTLPSAHDLCMCNEFKIPFVIVSIPEGDLRIVQPESMPLIGRPWSLGSYDCWGLIMAFHEIHGVKLNDFRQPYEWWKEGENLYQENYLKEGFVPVDDREPVFGDMIIFQLQADVWNHAGIYIGDNQILHHTSGKLSRRDIYSGWYQQHKVMICRHKDLKYDIPQTY